MVKVRLPQVTQNKFDAEDTFAFKAGAWFIRACVALPFVAGLGNLIGLM